MPALNPSTALKRDYQGSVEYINGVDPSVDQLAYADDINNHADVLRDHKIHIDSVFAAEHDFVADFLLSINSRLIPDSLATPAAETDFVELFDSIIHEAPGE